MNQFQYDMICKIIQNGAPALAKELCDALQNFVGSYNSISDELQALREELKAKEVPEENK
jgi:hypothetical protein